MTSPTKSKSEMDRKQRVLILGATIALMDNSFLEDDLRDRKTFVIEAPESSDFVLKPSYRIKYHECHDDVWRRQGKKRGKRGR